MATAVIALNNINRLSVRDDTLNVIILVAGTVDPINHDIETRANSYGDKEDDKSWYWAENSHFRRELEQLCKKYPNTELFPFHGWTGDNRHENREVAGAYLVNKLCGAENQTPFYESTYQNKKIVFHLIGHSHGGNVVNEFTRQADKLAKQGLWPTKWKIKTITYLSTPFFTKLHQPIVSGDTFDPDCKVMSVYNDFDLTQRTIADFNLLPMADIQSRFFLQLKKEGKKKAAQVNAQDTKVDFELILAAFKKIGPNPKMGLNISWNPLEWGLEFEWQWSFKPGDGEKVYDECLKLFNNITDQFDAYLALSRVLNQEVEFDISEKMVNDLGQEVIVNKRKIISDDIQSRIITMFERIIGGIRQSVAAFRERRKSVLSGERYTILDFISDIKLSDFLVPIIELLKIDDKTLSGPTNLSLTSFIHDILVSQIDQFDNTERFPMALYKKAGWKDFKAIKVANVTIKDPYCKSSESQNFYRFIKKVEGIEQRYADNGAYYDLMDLFFTLITHYGAFPTLLKDYWYAGSVFKAICNLWRVNRWADMDFSASEFEQRLNELSDIINSYQAIFEERNCGVLEEAGHKPDASTGMLKRGNIAYFAMFSHSVSRHVLHPELSVFLEDNIVSKAKRG